MTFYRVLFCKHTSLSPEHRPEVGKNKVKSSSCCTFYRDVLLVLNPLVQIQSRFRPNLVQMQNQFSPSLRLGYTYRLLALVQFSPDLVLVCSSFSNSLIQVQSWLSPCLVQVQSWFHFSLVQIKSQVISCLLVLYSRFSPGL